MLAMRLGIHDHLRDVKSFFSKEGWRSNRERGCSWVLKAERKEGGEGHNGGSKMMKG